MYAYLFKMIAHALVISFFCLGLAGNGIGSPMGAPEHNVDRPGEDIMPGFSSPHWSACSTSCATNDQCRAYTYVKPPSPDQDGTCWLKDKVPGKKANSCCVSGVRIMSPFEEGIDRPGWDIKPGFDVPTRSSCESECRNNPQCKAFTFVKPGYQGPQGKCWLKNKVPPKKANHCCDSGIKLIGPIRVKEIDKERQSPSRTE